MDDKFLSMKVSCGKEPGYLVPVDTLQKAGLNDSGLSNVCFIVKNRKKMEQRAKIWKIQIAQRRKKEKKYVEWRWIGHVVVLPHLCLGLSPASESDSVSC